MLRSLFTVCNLFPCVFSVPMMFELPFECSRMVLLAEVSAKWINFDNLIFNKLWLLLLVRRIFAIIFRHIIATAIFTFN